ncbi:MAG TPA: TetR/AcrR family transcriptional regulator [Spirochaetota bacterium]|nr:TetR/AcrR family transcriptional regulator [Spirochaetota bacterium]HOD14723.1 TetR/AcrR family transcriptional regulator [Spirochaetota bacterium]HPG51864.1 TetR/AcrR family transcriptional regulator [Spirochaetota bacterium]HPN12965.1 TetR/AcrR family transcriptional regulator [Spirochaetota bacterium]HQL82788.1 TetR/AcrR family transcriptional regulator [Spirochaetota bacterium]
MRNLTLRQQEILDASLDIIARRGMQRMTIKNLARAIKVSEPALYRHFKSKFDILMTILVRYRKNLEDLFGQSDGETVPPVDAIERFYAGMFRSFEKQPALSIVIFSEDLFRYDSRLSNEATAIIKLTHDRIYRILRESVRQGGVRTDVPAEQLAWMVMGTMRLLVTRWRISGYRLGLVKEGRQAIGLLRRIIAPARKK